MPLERRLEEDDLRRAAARVEEAQDAEAWARLAFEWLTQQAEGRQLMAAKEPLSRRASELGLDPDDELGRVLARGAQTPAERAWVSAFAVRGLAADLERGAAGDARIARFLAHADWLELATPYTIYGLVDRVLDEPVAARLWASVGRQLTAVKGVGAPRFASMALRVAALAESDSDAAREALEGVRDGAESPRVRALAAALAGGAGGALPTSARVSGARGRVQPGRVRHALALLSGWAMLRWLVALVAYAVGLRRKVTVSLRPRGVEVETTASWLGRTIRSRRVERPLREVAQVVLGARYPSAYLLVGSVAFAVGVVFGGLTLFDGVRTGETILLLVGAGAILGGGALDLLLVTLWPARRGRVSVELRFGSGPAVAVADVQEADAAVFVDAVAARLGA